MISSLPSNSELPLLTETQVSLILPMFDTVRALAHWKKEHEPGKDDIFVFQTSTLSILKVWFHNFLTDVN